MEKQSYTIMQGSKQNGINQAKFTATQSGTGPTVGGAFEKVHHHLVALATEVICLIMVAPKLAHAWLPFYFVYIYLILCIYIFIFFNYVGVNT